MIEGDWESRSVEEAWAREVEGRCLAIDNGAEEQLNAKEIIQTLRQLIA